VILIGDDPESLTIFRAFSRVFRA